VRRLVTFILRLWVNAETDPPAYEGQMECVPTGEQAHIRQPEDITRFVQTHLNVRQSEMPRSAAEDSHGIESAE
jgi:hypothetical protein